MEFTGSKVEGPGFRVSGLWSLTNGFKGLGFKVFGVEGQGFRVSGLTALKFMGSRVEVENSGFCSLRAQRFRTLEFKGQGFKAERFRCIAFSRCG